MKKYLYLLSFVIILGLSLPSCGPSEKEIREKIEKERQDSIKAAEAKAEALRLEEERKRKEEERKKEEERRKWEASEEGKGWSYIKQRLKSPSTAKLVNYVGTEATPCQDLAKAINLPGLGIAMYQVDAQNGYGAMIRCEYLVFFKNGTPMHVEDASEVSGSPQNMRLTLQVNGY